MSEWHCSRAPLCYEQKNARAVLQGARRAGPGRTAAARRRPDPQDVPASGARGQAGLGAEAGGAAAVGQAARAGAAVAEEARGAAAPAADAVAVAVADGQSTGWYTLCAH